MLREEPIFLGGQGGIVGPLQIAYGTVIPAGVNLPAGLHNRRNEFGPPSVLSFGAQKICSRN